jgi:hypothetical protein
MERERAQRLRDLPPAEHAVGIYIGLLIGGLVLGIGASLLFRDLFLTFTTRGIKIDELILFRIFLFFAASFAAAACFIGFYRMLFLQKLQVRKVDREFKDFTMYARPLVEEIIRQRIISENLSEKLDNISRKAGFGDKSVYDEGPPALRELAKRGEFLTSVAVLSSMSIGLFIYLERHPWELVPYSLIIMAVAWWYVTARYFDLNYDIRSYYFPAMFILLMPSLSIILRAFIRPYQVVYLVFALLFLYVWAMYTYFDYITGGKAPEIFSVVSTKVMDFPPSRRLVRAVGNGDVSERINGLFPERKNNSGKTKNGDMSDRINGLFPERKKGNGEYTKKARNSNMSKRVNNLFPQKKDGKGRHYRNDKIKNSDMSKRVNNLFPQKKDGKGDRQKKTKNGEMSDHINGLFPQKKDRKDSDKKKNGEMSDKINGLFPKK